MQGVSTFGTFCNIHALATGGSFANFSNSVTDFGRRGLIAQGYYREPYLSGSVAPLQTTDLTTAQLAALNYVQPGDGSAPYYASSISELAFKPNKTGKGYAERPNDTTWPRLTIASPGSQPGHIQAQGRVKIKALEAGETSTGLFQLELLNSEGSFTPGAGYKSPPTVTIDAPTEDYIEGSNDKLETAEAFARLGGVSKIRVTITRGLPLRFANNRRPDTGSIVRIHGIFYTVFGATPVDGAPSGTYDITFEGLEGAPPYADVGHDIEFFFVSSLSTGGHVFEFCGDDVSGCTYNSLPEYGGNYTESNQLITVPPAKMFYTSSDHKGKQKIGPFFTVDQANGSVTLDAKSFDLSKISGLGPFVRKNVVQGVRVEEISSSVELVSSVGAPDDAALPTQAAVKKYVDKRAVPSVTTGNAGNVLRIDPFGSSYVWAQNSVESLGVVQVNLRADVITGLIADGDATVYGNVTCDTLIANVEAGTITTHSIARSLPTIAGASGSVTHDYNVGSVWYHTSPSANFTVALINVPIDATFKVYEITLVIDQGATPRMPTSLSINGSQQTIKWKSNIVPIGAANAIDTVSFKLLWLVGTWVVVGS
jgi:hypothetical protein